MDFRTGTELLKTNPHLKQRKQFTELMEHLQSGGAENQYVYALYGLPGTGKTTLLEQAINALLSQGTPPEAIGYITGETGDHFDVLYRELENNRHHFRYLFINEIGCFSNLLLDGCFLYDTLVRIYNCKVIIADATPLAIYVAMKRTLYDRCRAIHIPHLSFEEHCKFVAAPDTSREEVWKDYLQLGGLFQAPPDVTKYIQLSFTDPILALLETQPKKEVLAWLEPDVEHVDWNQLVNTILTLSIRNHLPNNAEAPCSLNNEPIAQEFSRYFSLSKQGRPYRMKHTQTVALLDYLVHCGVLACSGEEPSQCHIQIPLLQYHAAEKIFGTKAID